MVKISIHEAKTHLSRLLKRVACGEEVIIAKGDRPIARLVPYSPQRRRELGRDQGLFSVPEGFNDPLPEDVLKSFEGS